MAGVFECYTTRRPIVAPRLFKTRTTTFILFIVFFQGISFFSLSYFLPLYYQILGSDATMAGVRTLPFSLGSSITSMAGGLIVAKTGRYKELIALSLAIYALGLGTMILLDERSSIAEQVLTTLVAALGCGRVSFASLVCAPAVY